LVGAWRLVRQSTSILLESVPSHVRLQDVKESLLSIDGVHDVHDLHVWTLSSGRYALSAHIVVMDKLVSDCSGVVSRSEEMLREKFAISHTTFQLECQACAENSCVFQAPK
jgi:cobalt-zinc-cadmium efflux system protein